MPPEKFDLLNPPHPIRGPINDLVRALNAASTKEAIEREGTLEIALILGLETAKRLKPADIKALSMIFDDAAQTRLQQLAEA